MRAYFFCVLLSIIIIYDGESLVISLEEVTAALEDVRSGDTIYVRNGEYNNIKLKIQDKHYDSYVVIRPVDYGEVVISGESLFHVFRSSNIIFEGFYFTRTIGSTFILNECERMVIANNLFFKCGSRPTHSIIRIVNGSSDNLIRNNTFDGSRAQSILISAYPEVPQDKQNIRNRIIRNYFQNVPAVNQIYPDLGKNGLECIMIGFGGAQTSFYPLYTLVYQNLFENVVGDGWEIISNKTSNNIIRENTFLCNNSGLSIRAGNHVLLENNYMYKTTKGIRLFGKGHIVRHNFIIDSNVGIRLPSSDFCLGEKTSQVGYYRQDSIRIEENWIINSNVNAINIGEDDRKLQPKNIFLLKNKIYDFAYNDSPISLGKKQSVTKNYRNKIIHPWLRMERILLKINRRRWYNSIESGKKIVPFKSDDSRVGINWKKSNNDS